MTTLAELYSALKYRVEVDQYGTRRYYNNKGEMHREDGPAIEYHNGSRHWYRNNLMHRDGGPAVENANGYKEWWRDGLLHRVGGPAIEYITGNKRWFLNGVECTEYNYSTKIAALGLANAK